MVCVPEQRSGPDVQNIERLQSVACAVQACEVLANAGADHVEAGAAGAGSEQIAGARTGGHQMAS